MKAENIFREAGELQNLTAYMKPRIRLVCSAVPKLWECRAQRVVSRDGWVYVEMYGKRGHGYNPAQAYQEWEQQQ